MQEAVLSPPLGEVLNQALGRRGDSPPAGLLLSPPAQVVLDDALPDRVLADREIGRILQSLLAESRATKLHLGESCELSGVERWLRPTFTWLRIELCGSGIASAGDRLDPLLGDLGYRRLERLRLEDAEGTLALYWRTDAASLPLMVERRRADDEERLALLFPQIRF
ncbi:MAG: hypothetical protein ACREQJ_15590 [Candidatus Binatia bacterium]